MQIIFPSNIENRRTLTRNMPGVNKKGRIKLSQREEL